MEYFLKDFANRILENPEYQSDDTLVVFPNRRAGMFLRKHLSDSGKVFMMPGIEGMDDFVSEVGNMEIVKNEFLLFELFKVHKEMTAGKSDARYQDFEDFIPFADILLKDFSDIDLHMVSAKDVFANVRNSKAMDWWDVSNPGMTQSQERYLAFYESLSDYYERLHRRLNDAGRAYSAMIYRKVAEEAGSNESEFARSMKWKKMFFVGFCELSESESVIMNALCREGKAEFVSDGDRYYYNPADASANVQEAGDMIRRNARKVFGFKPSFEENFSKSSKKMTFAECPENIMQAEYAGNLVSQLVGGGDVEDTALVLADENLLFPVLNALPKDVGEVNITMGFPYKDTKIHDFVLGLFTLYGNVDGENRYYIKDILGLLSQSVIDRLVGIRGLHAVLQKRFFNNMEARIFRISAEDLSGLLEEKFGTDTLEKLAIFFPPQKPGVGEFISRYLTFVKSAYGEMSATDKVAMEYSAEIFGHLSELQSDGTLNVVDTLKILGKIYERIASCVRMSFQGEPLKGFQIMGMQETKNLDFKNIIMLSCNESVIPRGNARNSMIPFNVKRHHGMFTYLERDAAEAFYFYRLLQRSENMCFVYHTETSGKGKGEQSRFLVQMEKELCRKYPEIVFEKRIISTAQGGNRGFNVIEKPKTGDVVARLKEMADTGKGIAATSLNHYIACPLRFYYEMVLGVNSGTEYDESLDSSEFGTAVHNVLEHVFGKFKGKTVEKPVLEGLDLQKPIQEEFDKIFQGGRKNEGENYFLYSIAKKQIEEFIEHQKQALDEGGRFEIIDLEDDIHGKIKTESGIEVDIHGKIDRIEKVDGKLRIADYKTGRLKVDDLKYGGFDEGGEMIPNKNRNEAPPSEKWFQVMYYAWLYWKKSGSPEGFQIEAGIYPLQYRGDFFAKASWGGGDTLTTGNLRCFEKYLAKLVSEIYDENRPFVQSSDTNKSCKYCGFKNVCGVVVRKW